VTTGGETITGIQPQISINDKGNVAFVATLDNQGTSGANLLMAGAAGQPPREIGLPTTPGRQYFLPQINNSNVVVARDRQGPSASTLVSLSGSGGETQTLTFGNGAEQILDYDAEIQNVLLELGPATPGANGTVTYSINHATGTVHYFGTAQARNSSGMASDGFSFDITKDFNTIGSGGQLVFSFGSLAVVQSIDLPLPVDASHLPDVRRLTFTTGVNATDGSGSLALQVAFPSGWSFTPPYTIDGQVVSDAGERIRKWDAGSPGTGTVVAGTEAKSPPGPTTRYDLLSQASLANDGGVSFIGLTGGLSKRNLYFAPAGAGKETQVASVLAGGALPIVSAIPGSMAHRTVWRDVTAAGGAQIEWADDSTAHSLVSTSPTTWTVLGKTPGISDDGNIIAFYGEKPASQGIPASKGIFASIHTSGGANGGWSAPQLITPMSANFVSFRNYLNCGACKAGDTTGARTPA
jgi:hypothetical protein